MKKIKSSVKKVNIDTIEVYDLKPGVRGYDKMVSTGKRVKCTVLTKECLDHLIVNPKISRKKAIKLYGISTHLYQNSIHYWYDYNAIKGQSIDKIVKANIEGRRVIWQSSLDMLEPKYPGITDIFLNNLTTNPKLISEKLEELNSDFYEIKAFIRLTKKYIRQACKRHGVPYLKMPANLSEYRVKSVLKSLGYTPETQFYLKPYWYDFRIGKLIIEYDGRQTHNNDGTLNRRDTLKQELANKEGYTVVRIPFEINGLRTDINLPLLKNTIKKILKKYENLLKD